MATRRHLVEDVQVPDDVAKRLDELEDAGSTILSVGPAWPLPTRITYRKKDEPRGG